MTTAQKIESRLKKLGDEATAAQSMRFFKTGPGQYGEGDLLIGIRAPVLRSLSKELIDTPLEDAVELLQSPIHEVRMLALFILVLQAKRGHARSATALQAGDASLPLYRAYLANTARINNWDLVDVSAAQIVGAHLFKKDRKPLTRLAKSNSLWERRIAIISTFHFIRQNEFDDTLAIADLLLNDPEDLMHKAVGWMLREVGKRDLAAEENFLIPRYKRMPRTMLRYAIERFPEPLRRAYLNGKK
ncbi:MAG: DNA alkylation repair protein [Kiritimatiellales bacterium]|nr:DNA alkylation repair protein [Kiritimatiellota bacterium]MBL7011922.1 DNA alkylation repair protein [Kiritimatiellales bacterium]